MFIAVDCTHAEHLVTHPHNAQGAWTRRWAIILESAYDCIRQERAGEESILDFVRCDDRSGAGPGGGPGVRSAGGWDYYGDGGVSFEIFLILHLFFSLIFIRR